MSQTNRGYQFDDKHTLPYERLISAGLASGIKLQANEHVLVLQPFGWHLDGKHLPNQAEHFERDGVIADLKMTLLCEFGPYVAILREAEA